MGLSETLDPPFRLIWNTVVRNVEAMPEPSFEFRPEGLEMRSFREIALHMANVCVTLSENIGKAQWERVTAYPPETTRSKAQVLEAPREAGERVPTRDRKRGRRWRTGVRTCHAHPGTGSWSPPHRLRAHRDHGPADEPGRSRSHPHEPPEISVREASRAAPGDGGGARGEPSPGHRARGLVF